MKGWPRLVLGVLGVRGVDERRREERGGGGVSDSVCF